MDPNTTYSEMLFANKSGNTEAAKRLAKDLQAWLEKGGFKPEHYDLLKHRTCLNGRLI